MASFIATAFYAYGLGGSEIYKQDYYFSAAFGLLGNYLSPLKPNNHSNT
jgi:hypothetical protein